MRSWLLALLLAAASASVLAQIGDQIEQMKLRQLQTEIDFARIQADTDRRRYEDEQAKKIEQLNELIERRKADDLAAKKKVEDAADDLREELNQSAVRSANLTYLAVTIAVLGGLGFYVVKRESAEGYMKYEQKFGVVFMLCALLLSLVAITISSNWAQQYDVLQNIMMRLRISFLPEYDSAEMTWMIDIPTKYVLAVMAAVFTYGFTTYLNITPAWKRSSKVSPPQDVASEP